VVVFFDWKGTVDHEFVPRGQMVNKQLYQEVLFKKFVLFLNNPHIFFCSKVCVFLFKRSDLNKCMLVFRSKSCKKDLWTQINAALQANGK